jgi:tRNA threonylcarbamoyl adenosine modification protein (Sua5/YciO/YrdC/YwlC family)
MVAVLDHEAPDVLDRIAAVLLEGGAVVLPTDTVYGLVALPGDPAASAQLFMLKGRADQTPLAVLCADADQALALVEPPVDAGVRAVAERWWPGPLTLVLPRRAGLHLHLGEPTSTIGVRVPDDALLRDVASRVGPIAATSANRHGQPPATTAAAASEALGPGVRLVIDGGPASDHVSTVIDATRRPWRVLREGPIAAAAILVTAGAASPDDR